MTEDDILFRDGAAFYASPSSDILKQSVICITGLSVAIKFLYVLDIELGSIPFCSFRTARYGNLAKSI